MRVIPTRPFICFIYLVKVGQQKLDFTTSYDWLGWVLKTGHVTMSALFFGDDILNQSDRPNQNAIELSDCLYRTELDLLRQAELNN